MLRPARVSALVAGLLAAPVLACPAILAAALLWAAPAVSLAAQPAPSAEPVPAESDPNHHFVVVTFANNPYRPAARAGSTGRRYSSNTYGIAQNAHTNAQHVARAYSLKEIISWPIKELGVHCVVYEIPDARPLADVLAALAKDPRVTLAQPLQEFRTLTNDTDHPAPEASYNDPLYGLQTNLVSLGIPGAHERAQGDGVRVALIDTGVDTAHPDLRDRITRTRSFVASSLIKSGAPPAPAGAASYRHGTAMAGLIAAVANNKVGIVGIAPLAHIEVFEACWQLKPDSDAAACNTFTLAQAIAAALEAGAPLINMSIAGPADPLLSALVQTGLKRGVIFVGSASDEPNSFPTNIEGVIGVGSSEREHTNTTLSAPGSHVLTLLPGNQYDFESGTSVAAAQVTGVVALLLSADNHLSADNIVQLLKGSPGTVPGAVLNVSAALAKVQAGRGMSRLARSAH